MPFWKFSKKSSPQDPASAPLTTKERKALLGLKVIQAQQNPEPIYDLSNCGASSLPDDTYTFCKLLGKIAINISGNCLTNLDSGGSISSLVETETIDANHNKIDKIPPEISILKKLRVLNLSYNKLKSLPDTFNALPNLRELYLSNNKFSRVPLSICALPRLQVLDLKGNDISILPNDLCSLNSSLHTLDIDLDKIDNIPQEILSSGLDNIMKHLCELKGIEYVGPSKTPDESSDVCTSEDKLSSSPAMDDIMIEYIRKKQIMLQSQIQAEERFRAQEREQLESVLHNSSKSKAEILTDISDSPKYLEEYETKKQEKLDEQIKLEESFRLNQEEELGAYLSNTSGKEALLMDISAQEENLQQEVEAIVAAKEKEKTRLLADLSTAEQATDAALTELVQGNQAVKSSEFVDLLKDQEEQMNKILLGISEATSDLRKSEVIKAMQSDLMKEMLMGVQRQKIEQNQKSWVSTMVHEGALETAHLQSVMSEKASAQNELISNLLKEEQYQAEAFKLLLLKLDLKRSNVIRQIAQVEYELARLSSLEVRKKKCGLQYGSTTMLNQRKTLVGLLYSLLKAKDDRDKELNDWFCELSNHNSDMSSEDFWLLQYQRLMAAKPDTITEAESSVEEEIREILSLAYALDLLPLFARHKISYSQLLEMSEEDFDSVGMGSATYHSIQRALNSYLNTKKVGKQEPSAPAEDELPNYPSAPPEEVSVLSDEASAPPLSTAFVEAECVVCLNSEPCIIFLPCGHVCSCAKCCEQLVNCPLCRIDITSKCYIEQL